MYRQLDKVLNRLIVECDVTVSNKDGDVRLPKLNSMSVFNDDANKVDIEEVVYDGNWLKEYKWSMELDDKVDYGYNKLMGDFKLSEEEEQEDKRNRVIKRSDIFEKEMDIVQKTCIHYKINRDNINEAVLDVIQDLNSIYRFERIYKDESGAVMYIYSWNYTIDNLNEHAYIVLKRIGDSVESFIVSDYYDSYVYNNFDFIVNYKDRK